MAKMLDNQIYCSQSSKPLQRMIKRLLDMIFSVFALIIFSPIYFAVSICILIEDGRPVLFKQSRSGVKDTVFIMYKFRSMKKKTRDNSAPVYNWANGVPDDFVFKEVGSDHPDITRTGKMIRKYSLDELPQFLNVLKGDMSIVGPRPEIVDITRCYDGHQKKRLCVKPGITGWAQVNGRSSLNHGEKVSHDIYYVNHFSLWLDIKIMFKTVIYVFTAKDSV